MMHSLTRWTVGLAAALLAACGSDKPEVAETHKVDKIILFTVDTLRADQLGAPLDIMPPYQTVNYIIYHGVTS